MKTEIKTITINGTEYVEKGSQVNNVINNEGLHYVVIRSYAAGVFLGYLKKEECVGGIINITLHESKRLYQWYGAATLSQFAVEGTSKPKDCKIPIAIPIHYIKNVIEIIPISEAAKKTIDAVPVWRV